jgi:hypothetical protein
MPSLYRPRLLLWVSENISKSMHHWWSIFCIKQCIKAVYLSSHATNHPRLGASAVIVGISVDQGWQRAGDGVGGRAPRQPAGSPPGGMAHLAWRWLTTTFARPLARNANGGTSLPALAQAARATCRLARGAATQWGSFLANNFRGGLFYHFIGARGLICQKFFDFNLCPMEVEMLVLHEYLFGWSKHVSACYFFILRLVLLHTMTRV